MLYKLGITPFIQQQERIRFGQLENLYAIAFYHALSSSKFSNLQFFLSGAAANHSFLYGLLYVLENVKPKAILELGSGMTTNLTHAYAAQEPDSKVITLEEDEGWATIIRARGLRDSDNFHLITSPLKPILFDEKETFW